MKTDPKLVSDALALLKHLWLFCNSSAHKADENMRLADPEKQPTPDEWRFGRDLYLQVASRIKSQVEEVFGVDISEYELKPHRFCRGHLTAYGVGEVVETLIEYETAHKQAQAIKQKLADLGITFEDSI